MMAKATTKRAPAKNKPAGKKINANKSSTKKAGSKLQAKGVLVANNGKVLGTLYTK